MRLKPKARLFISLSMLAVAVAEPQMATAQTIIGDYQVTSRLENEADVAYKILLKCAVVSRGFDERGADTFFRGYLSDYQNAIDKANRRRFELQDLAGSDDRLIAEGAMSELRNLNSVLDRLPAPRPILYDGESRLVGGVDCLNLVRIDGYESWWAAFDSETDEQYRARVTSGSQIETLFGGAAAQEAEARRSKPPRELRRDLDLQAEACAFSGGGLNGDYQREVYADLYKDFRAFRAEREDLVSRMSRNEVGLDRDAAQRRIRELDEALAGLKSPNEIDCGDRELPGLAGDALAYSSRRLHSGESDTLGLRAQLRSSDTRQPSLGQEVGGSGVPELDLVDTQTTIQEFGAVAELSADLGLGPRLKFEAEYSRGEADKIILDFDPDGDARLLLPGPTGGASGLSLGNSAAFPNTATALFAATEYQNWNVSVAAQLLNADAHAVNLGLRYEQSNINQSLSGAIPGFDGAFDYNTELDHDRFAVFIEAGTGWTLVENDSGNPALTLGVGAEIEASHNDVSGQDSLNWSVFNGGTNGGGIELLDHDQFSVTGSAFAEVGIPLSDSAIVGAFAEAGIRVVPQITRNGSDPTEVELDRQEYWSVGVSLGIRY